MADLSGNSQTTFIATIAALVPTAAGIFGFMKWFYDKLTKSSDTVVSEQKDIIKEIKELNEKNNARIDKLQEMVDMQTKALDENTKKIHRLSKYVQLLISQLVRAEITPVVTEDMLKEFE